MKRYTKAAPAVLLSAVLLTACGDSEEEETGSNNGNGGTTEAENGSNIANEEDNAEETETEYSETGDSDTQEQADENETNDETSNEEKPVPVQEGEEREAATAKTEDYIQAGTFTGGEITDGKSIGAIDYGRHEGYERLVLDIYEGSYQELGDPAEIPNDFEVTNESYPSRLIYTLNGIRGQSEELPDASNMTLFSSIETMPVFDDARIKLAAYAQESIEFEVFELHDPAKIVTDISPAGEEEYASVYSLRTASIAEDGRLEDTERKGSELEERDAAQVRILHSENDTLFVEEGYYNTVGEAEERKAELENDGIDFDLFIEERGMHDFPENIEL